LSGSIAEKGRVVVAEGMDDDEGSAAVREYLAGIKYIPADAVRYYRAHPGKGA